MKKSTLVVLIGGFIVLTAFLGPLSQEKMYKKQKNFNSPEEIITMLDGKPLLEVKNGERYNLKETKDFAECLSVRKRVTDADMDVSKFDVKEIIELDEKTEKDLLNYYNGLRERFTRRLPVTSEKAVRLKVNTYYIDDYRTGQMKPVEESGYDDFLDIVLIDEGEGYVIDFVNMFDSNYYPDYSKVDEDGDLYPPGIDHKDYGMNDNVENEESISEGEINNEQEVEDNA